MLPAQVILRVFRDCFDLKNSVGKVPIGRPGNDRTSPKVTILTMSRMKSVWTHFLQFCVADLKYCGVMLFTIDFFFEAAVEKLYNCDSIGQMHIKSIPSWL